MNLYHSPTISDEQLIIDFGALNGALNPAAMVMPEGGFALLNHVAQNAHLKPATALAFDPNQELLWTGNSAGRVVSFHGGELTKYTSFRSASTDVRQITVVEDNNLVLSLTAQQLRANRRQGLPAFAHSSENLKDVCCCYLQPDVSRSLLIGGEQKKLVQFDLITQKETRIANLKQQNCLIIRSNSKYIFTCDSTGSVIFKSKAMIDDLHVLQAHQSIADFDAYGNKLITCGYSPRHGNYTGDRFLMIYDLRTLRSFPPYRLPFAPIFSRFIPTYSDSRCVVASRLGEMLVLDLNQPTNHLLPIHLDLNGMAVLSLDVSLSRQCIAFGDQSGFIHLFSDRANAVFNENFYPTEFVQPLTYNQKPMSFDDSTSLYSTVPLPFSTDDHYLSDWPENLCVRGFREPDPISDELLSSMKMSEFVGYARNPRESLRTHNIQPYSDIMHKTYIQVKKTTAEGCLHVIPSCYRRQSKAEENCDPLQRKATEFPLIELYSEFPQIPAIFMAMFYVMNLRALFIQHICDLSLCLSCEIGFIFRRMLNDKCSWTTPISIGSFKRSLCALDGYKEWSKLTETMNLPQKTRSFLQFLFKRLDKEMSSSSSESRFHEQTQFKFSINNHCIRCSSQFQSKLSLIPFPLVCTKSLATASFCTIVEKSLNARELMDADCSVCNTKARISCTRRVQVLPPITIIDAISGVDSECLQGGSSPSPSQNYGWGSAFKPFESTLCHDVQNNADQHQSIPDALEIKIADGICHASETKMDNATRFVLTGVVFGITEMQSTTPSHIITAVSGNKDESSQSSSSDTRWTLFNEHLVERSPKSEVLRMDASWKSPYVLIYMQENNDEIPCEITPFPQKIFDTSSFYNSCALNGNLPEEGEVVFIAFDRWTQANAEEEGDIELCEPFITRVTCVNAKGDCFIDDFVRPVHDDSSEQYLHRWSSVPTNNDNLVNFKTVHMKLITVLEKGAKFVTYGDNDLLRLFNIFIQPEYDLMHMFKISSSKAPNSAEKLLLKLLFDENCDKSEKATERDPDDSSFARAMNFYRLYQKYQKAKETGDLASLIASAHESNDGNTE